MAVRVSYPGVYIDEFAPGAPIQGVGTSTAAFIGIATNGDLNLPTRITSWDQFRAVYGDLPAPGFNLWYAVRGFFANGGQDCYVVRASNGAYAQYTLVNGAGQNMAIVRALQPGAPTPAIQVNLIRSNQLAFANTHLYMPTTTTNAIVVTGRELPVQNANEAARFRPGDDLNIGGHNAQLVQVRGNVLRLDRELTNVAAGTNVYLADTHAGTTMMRIESTANVSVLRDALVRGTMLTITQSTFSATGIVESVQFEPINAALTTYRVTFRQGLSAAFALNDPAHNAATVQTEDFSLAISQGGTPITYPNLSIDPASPRYYVDYVNQRDALVVIRPVETPPIAVAPFNLPTTTTSIGGVVGPQPLVGGGIEDLTTLNDTNFVTALDTLATLNDVNLLSIPDCQTTPVQQAVINQCELLADRFAILDASTSRLGPFGDPSVDSQHHTVPSMRGYAGLYYPWLRVLPAGGGAPILIPPSGHVCGIIARTDLTRGVHKAPANEIVNDAIGVANSMSNVDQGLLNLAGINIIRIFSTGGRPVLWGARTTATDSNWQYVNVRRLFLFLEKSIEIGIRWAVFEPNNLELWQKLRRTITEFLTGVWRDGALFGVRPEDAFYVRIDETLNPFSEQALGRLHIEIGIRPTYPAEFIIVRIGIWPGNAQISES